MSEPIVDRRDAGDPSTWVARLALAATLLGFAMSRAYPAAVAAWSPQLADYWVTVAMALTHVGFVVAVAVLPRQWRSEEARRRARTLSGLALALAGLTYVWVP